MRDQIAFEFATDHARTSASTSLPAPNKRPYLRNVSVTQCFVGTLAEISHAAQKNVRLMHRTEAQLRPESHILELENLCKLVRIKWVVHLAARKAAGRFHRSPRDG